MRVTWALLGLGRVNVDAISADSEGLDNGLRALIKGGLSEHILRNEHCRL